MIREMRDYESLIWNLEHSARENPQRYKSRVAMLSTLGYAYIAGVVVAFLAGVFGVVLLGRWILSALGAVNPYGLFIVVLFTIPVFWFLRGFLDAVMVDLPKPDGAELRRDVAPALFQVIDEVAGKLKTPSFDHVILDREFNAGIVQYPRYGLYGKTINYITIGIPLLKASSPEQFKSILAHELGHVSGNHSRFNNKIYHLSQIWNSLFDNAGDNVLIRRFLDWYVPYFNAYSFALRRANEYEADKCAADVTGAEMTASTLVAIKTLAPYWHEKYWPSLIKRTEDVDTPDVKPFSLVFEEGFRPVRDDRIRWYRRALDEKSGVSDEHPCLVDRLSALGYRIAPAQRTPPVPVPEMPAETAAQKFLGKWLEKYTQMLDNGWTHHCADKWRRAHEEAQVARDELDELKAKAAEGQLDPKRALNYIRLTDDVDGRAAGLEKLREYLNYFPQDAPANYLLGSWLLEEGDESGIAAFEQAASIEPKRRIHAYREISDFYKERGEPAKAAPYDDFVRKNVAVDRAEVGRVDLRQSDRFVYHSLPAETINQVRQHLSTQMGVRAAYMMQRQRADDHRPVYVLIVDLEAQYGYRDLDEFAMLIRRGINVPGELAVEFATGQMKWLKKVGSEMRSSLIYGNV